MTVDEIRAPSMMAPGTRYVREGPVLLQADGLPDPHRRVDDANMRFVYVAAALMAIAVIAASPAHADTHSYLRCIKSDVELPPGAEAKNLPTVAFIETEINSGKSREQVAQELVGLGVKPDEAVLRVWCFVANWPIGTT
jgi:hypothetical protein